MLKIDSHLVEGAYLLSREEVKKLPVWILANGYLWWLRTPGLKDEDVETYLFDRPVNYNDDNASVVCCVYYDGDIYDPGYFVNDKLNVCVRPALKVANLDEQNLVIGDLVEVFGLLAQYIGNNSVLLCESIGVHNFDESTDDYDNSELKVWLNNWLKDIKE